MSSTDNRCKQFVPRSGLNVRPDMDQNYLTLVVFLKELFEKVDFEKNQQTTNSMKKLPRMQKVKLEYRWAHLLALRLIYSILPIYFEHYNSSFRY